MKREIEILVNKSEITAGTRGSSLGPEALMVVSRDRNNDFFSRHAVTHIEDMNHVLDTSIKFENAKRIEALVQVFQNVNDSVKSTIESGKFPLILAADHGSAGGTLAGIKSANPDKRLGVIWIDAHADIHTPYTTPSGNMHLRGLFCRAVPSPFMTKGLLLLKRPCSNWAFQSLVSATACRP